MDAELFTLCAYAKEKGGSLTVLSTFDDLCSANLPFRAPSCYVVARVRFLQQESGEIPVEIKITAPDGQNVIPPFRTTKMVHVPPCDESGTTNICAGLGFMNFRAYGKYSMTLSLCEQVLKILPFFVKCSPQPNEQTPKIA